MRSRHIWVPALWTLYGAAYAAVFISHGRAAEAAITAAFTLAVGAGLAAELRMPRQPNSGRSGGNTTSGSG